jgi:hypothetical protein
MSARLAALLLIGVMVSGCWRWVPEEVAVARCLGGKVNIEKRITDVTVVGRTRNTTIRTDACLD